MVGVMPRREAVSRSIHQLGLQALVLLVAGHVAQLRQLLAAWPETAARIDSVPPALGSSSVYWYCVRLTRSSTVRSCTGCMNNVMPATLLNCGCRRRITSEALILRSSSGLRLIRMRPLFSVGIGAVRRR